jgi:6-phosphofructokinase 1
MNPFIRSWCEACYAFGIKCIGVEGGYEGLIRGKFRVMGVRDVSGILQRGGTILQTARQQRVSRTRRAA